MQRLNPAKLYTTYLPGVTPEQLALPRRYTLTHSDITGELFLSIGNEYDKKQFSGLYTRLMRDEVLAELVHEGENPVFKVYCHVSGGFVFGTAKWRHSIFQSELPLALEAIRYGERVLFEQNPELDNVHVLIHFHSTNSRFNKVENWGSLVKYR
jgi:hypothetical protein